MTRLCLRTMCAFACAAFGPMAARAQPVPNPSFELGAGAPDAWRLCDGAGSWLAGDAAAGNRSIAVRGTGDDLSYWRSDPLALVPGQIYRLSFSCRRLDGTGGAPISGPILANRCLPGATDAWKPFESFFVAQKNPSPDNSWLRFGQWHVPGGVAFDDVRLERVQAVYARQADVQLGAGEAIKGHAYSFQAPFNAPSANHSRALAWQQCYFNTNRWVFGEGSEVVYRHHIEGRRQLSAAVSLSISHYVAGALAVDFSTDGETWQVLGEMRDVSSQRFQIPTAAVPAPELWIRLSARAQKRVGTDGDAGSLQVGTYAYEATLEGAALELRGVTRFLAVTQADPRLRVTIEDLGGAALGQSSVVRLSVRNLTDTAVPLRPTVTIAAGDRSWRHAAEPVELAPGLTTLDIPYRLPEPGEYDLGVTLGEGTSFRAETQLVVPHLYAANYGQLLPASGDQAALWWAQSGWRVSRTRGAPRERGACVRLRAARNETDAAQVVIRPARRMTEFTAVTGPLRGPQGTVIPAANVEVLRVHYVEVAMPSDGTSVAGPWPDALPPLRSPIELEPDLNQPLWVRVGVPRDAPAGVYDGVISLRAQDFEADVPLQVTVYGFTLPDRMTCTTAFGFSPANVWRYQKVDDPSQRRAVLETYWRNLSAHHISPYDPAPLDPLEVTWPQATSWSGGARDPEVSHGGQYALRIEDTSESHFVSARNAGRIPVSAQGLKLAFWYKTHEPGHEFVVSLNHYDADDNWFRGRNNDASALGNGEWQRFERSIAAFPPGTASVHVLVGATLYTVDGRHRGTVWLDDVSLRDLGTDAELLPGGGFEAPLPASLVPSFDWTGWDAAMRRAIDTYHFNSFRLRVQGLGGGTFHSRREPSLLGFAEGTPQYRQAFANYCGQLESHLRENGWLDEAFVYWFDEPDQKDYAFVSNGFRKLKECAPGLNRVLTEQVEPELIGGPNIWCPVLSRYGHEAAEQRRAHGERFWWYVCCSPKAPYATMFTDHPATDLRVWLWQSWKYNVVGVLVWHINYWTSPCAYPDPEHPQNVYEDPMAWVSGYDTPKGVKKPWWNGAGHFIYPPEQAADAHPAAPVLDGPVDSIRWEMLRDGIEDYEYLAMLRRLLERHGAGLSTDERRRLTALLDVPAAITSDLTTFTKDPAPIEEHRDKLARALEALVRR